MESDVDIDKLCVKGFRFNYLRTVKFGYSFIKYGLCITYIVMQGN